LQLFKDKVKEQKEERERRERHSKSIKEKEAAEMRMPKRAVGILRTRRSKEVLNM